MAAAAGSYRFLSGAEMDPTEVLTRYPGSRFVARARLLSQEAGEGAGEEIWGILVRVPSAEGTGIAGEERQAVTDDGRPFPALVEDGGRPAGEPRAIVAAARYWELPPAYVRRLEAEAGGASESA